METVTTETKKKDKRWMKRLSRELIESILEFNPKQVLFNVNHNRFIACVIELEDNTAGIGISICSLCDEFDVKRGSILSAGRAVGALKRKESSDPIRCSWEEFPNTWTKYEIERLMDYSDAFGSKSIYIRPGDREEEFEEEDEWN